MKSLGPGRTTTTACGGCMGHALPVTWEWQAGACTPAERNPLPPPPTLLSGASIGAVEVTQFNHPAAGSGQLHTSKGGRQPARRTRGAWPNHVCGPEARAWGVTARWRNCACGRSTERASPRPGPNKQPAAGVTTRQLPAAAKTDFAARSGSRPSDRAGEAAPTPWLVAVVAVVVRQSSRCCSMLPRQHSESGPEPAAHAVGAADVAEVPAPTSATASAAKTAAATLAICASHKSRRTHARCSAALAGDWKEAHRPPGRRGLDSGASRWWRLRQQAAEQHVERGNFAPWVLGPRHRRAEERATVAFTHKSLALNATGRGCVVPRTLGRLRNDACWSG